MAAAALITKYILYQRVCPQEKLGDAHRRSSFSSLCFMEEEAVWKEDRTYLVLEPGREDLISIQG